MHELDHYLNFRVEGINVAKESLQKVREVSKKLCNTAAGVRRVQNC